MALIGFSQRARLAIASAADNPDIQALVAFYARLPRTNELNADITAVPLAHGDAVHGKAQSLGAARGLGGYPGEGRGFDFSESSAAAIDVRQRVMAFIREQLP